MKLMNLDEYLDTRYTKLSRPSKKTLIKLINHGEIPGKKRGRFYYIDVEAESRKTGNPLVDHVLEL
jgi:hypothetical protein